ncbi:hypothetical protein V2J09_023342 [Rumex salicifolius]
MAETVDESAFWLPSEFLTDEDLFLMANQRSNPGVLLPPSNGVEIPLYRRSSSALNSPGESVVSSTETESSDDPDEFIAELTRHLAQSALRERAAKPHHHQPQPQEKSWCALATSPQSTLTGFTGWTNRRPGGSRTPPNQPPPAFDANHEEAWELIYAAAERVAKMRLNSQAQMMNQQQSVRRGLLSASHMELRTPPVRYNASQNNHIQQIKNQVKQAWLSQQQLQNRGGNSAVHGLPQSSYPHLRTLQQSNHRHHHLNNTCTGGCGGSAAAGAGMRAVFLGGSGATGVKRQSTGTGVFLPRRVSSNSPTTEPRKKQGCSTVLLPARVVQALNLNLDEMNSHNHTHTQPYLAATNHDILVARRNASLAAATQQRRGLRGEGPMSHHETPLLPQEWTY